MNWNRGENECDYEENEEESYQMIDPNDLYIIDDPDWKPPKEYIVAYATQLGYNKAEDPKEMLDVAEKYLNYKLPDNIKRAFAKVNLQILYIDKNTQEINLSSHLEEEAKEEMEKIRKDYLNKKKGKKAVARGTDDELKKKLEQQKNQMFNEEKIKNLNLNDSEDDANKENSYNNINPEIHLEDNTNKLNLNLNNEINIDINNDDSDDDNKKKNTNKNGMKNIKNNASNTKKYGQAYDAYFDLDNSSDNDKDKDKANNQKNNLALHLNLNENEEEENEEVEHDFKEDEEDLKINHYMNNEKNRKKSDKNDDDDNPKITAILNKNQNRNEPYLNLNDSNDSKGSNNNILRNKNKNVDYTKEKKIYLEKIKKDFKNFKKKTIGDYIRNKENIISDLNKNFLKNSQNKIKSDLSKEQNEKLKNFEETLKENKMTDLNKYKNQLETDFENKYLKIYNNNENEGLIDMGDLEIKKQKLESEIRIQKRKNDSKKESKNETAKVSIESKKSYISEISKSKKSQIELKNKNKINKMEKDLLADYDNYIKMFQNANRKMNLNDSGTDKNKIDKLLSYFSNELKEKFEDEKSCINREIEEDMLTELEKFKIKAQKDKENSLQKINEDLNNLEKNYYMELDKLKSGFSQKNKKMEENINNNLSNISSIFDDLKNNHLNNVNKEIKDIENSLQNISKEKNGNEEDNYIFGNDNEMIEIKTEELLTNKLNNEKMKLNKFKSFFDMKEKEFINTEYNIEYVSQALLIVCRLLNEKSSIFDFEQNSFDSRNKDDSVVIEIISNVSNKYTLFQMKYNQNQDKNKLYPFLDSELKKLLDILYRDADKNKITDLLYSHINNENNKSYFNNSNLKSRNINNDNITNKSLSYRMNNTNLLFSRPNNIINNNFKSTNNFIKMNQSFSPSTNLNPPLSQNRNYLSNNNYNNLNSERTLNNYSNLRYNNINSTAINPNLYNEDIKEEGELVISSIFSPNDITPQLSEDIVNGFSDELSKLYNKINKFLIEESYKITEEIKEINRKKDMNKKLKDLKENEDFNQDLFNQIYSNEENNLNKKRKNIEDKLKVFNIIKSYCEDTFNFISNNSDRQDIFKDKFNILLSHIEDYNQNYYNNFKKDINLDYIINNNRYSNNRMSNDYNGNRMNFLLSNLNNKRINTFRSTANNNIRLNNFRKLGGITDRYNYNFQ